MPTPARSKNKRCGCILKDKSDWHTKRKTVEATAAEEIKVIRFGASHGGSRREAGSHKYLFKYLHNGVWAVETYL